MTMTIIDHLYQICLQKCEKEEEGEEAYKYFMVKRSIRAYIQFHECK